MSVVSGLMAFCVILSVILGILGWGVSKLSYEDREKSSSFECGFDPKSIVRMSFSLKFFLIAVIFLIFDVEIVLLVPMPLIFEQYSGFVYFFVLQIFLVILLIGLMYEWAEGALNWSF